MTRTRSAPRPEPRRHSAHACQWHVRLECLGRGPRGGGGHGHRHLHAADRAHPNGAAQWNARVPQPDPQAFAEVAAGGDPQSRSSETWCWAASTRSAGDIYVSGNVHLREGGMVTGYGAPAITVAPGKVVTSTNPLFDVNAVGAVGQGQITPLPVLSNAEGSGIIDQIRSKVTNADGTPKMTGRYQDATVYNLAEIFAQLGATNEGNRERNLARPGGCTFGVGERGCEVSDLAGSRDPRPQANVRVRVRACGSRADGQAELLLHGIAAQPVGRAAGHPLLRHLCRGRQVQPRSSISSSSRRSTLARHAARRDPRRQSQRRGQDRSARRLHRGDGSGDGQGHGAPAVDLLRGRVLAHGRVGHRGSPTMAERRSSPASP